jgi:4-oxalocrotonate tautomerase
MPFVNVKVIKGVFNADEKQEMISKLTETPVGIEGENMRGVTWVTVDEVEGGDWGIGGQSITAEYVKELQAGRA